MLIILLFFVITFVMAEMPRLTFPILGAANTDVSDSVGKGQTVNTQLLPHSAKSDSTVIDTTTQVLADTAKMDSLQKAIWMHNKAIDDSLRADSINRQRKNGIDAPVEYTAEDSMTYEGASGLAHLYGQSHVKYQDMDLQSDQIFMQLDSSLVHATGSLDSLGKKFGTPIFKMGSDTYENDTIAFNFKTKKGLISDVYTQQDDGYMTAQLAKRGANGEIYLQHGRYTTCDKDHPDFYIALSRAKMRPGKDVVFGPAYLVVADVFTNAHHRIHVVGVDDGSHIIVFGDA